VLCCVVLRCVVLCCVVLCCVVLCCVVLCCVVLCCVVLWLNSVLHLPEKRQHIIDESDIKLNRINILTILYIFATFSRGPLIETRGGGGEIFRTRTDRL
jgi:hypothetical protein